MKTIDRRIRRLEISAGVIDTAQSRRERDLAEEFRRRINAGRARVGLPPLPEEPREDLSGLSLADVLIQGRERVRARALASSEASTD